MAPTQTGKFVAVKNEAEILARPGIRAVVSAPFWPQPVHTTVIVVADSYWIAKQAADALVVEFDDGAAAGAGSGCGESKRDIVAAELAHVRTVVEQ